MNVTTLAVVPVLVGPLQALLAILPGILVALGTALLAMFRPRVMWMGLKLLWRQKVVVVLAAATLTGCVLLARSLGSFGDSQIGRAEATTDGWPMFRGGLARRGWAADSPGPNGGGVNWSFLDGGPTYYSTPTVVSNRLYVTSAIKGPYSDHGAVYCLDADTGGLVWQATPRRFRATFSSPSVSGRYLVCGEGLHYTRDARVICLDVQRQGEVLWEYRTASHVESTPCIHDGRVYVGAGDDGYYCFRLEPDADGNPVLLWHAEGDRYPDAETSHVVCDDRVVIGLGMGGRAVCCLHAETGDELWRVETPYPVFGPPAVVDGRIFVGLGNGDYINSAEQAAQKELNKLREAGADAESLAVAAKGLGPIGQVWCVDLETGDVLWKYTTQRTILGAVAAGDGQLFFGSRDGHVYCISFDGRELGKWNAHAAIMTSPALTDEYVYVVTESGRLYGLTTDTLELVWEATLGMEGPFISSATVARGRVYVGTGHDGLLCLGRPDFVERKPIWPGQMGGPGRGGCRDEQPLPERGKFEWRFPADTDTDAAPASPLAVTAPVACVGNRVYVPVAEGRCGLVCLQDNPDSRDRPVELWSVESRNGVYLSPAAIGEIALFVDGQVGDQGRRLRAVDAQTGRVQWELPVCPDAAGEFLLSRDGGLIVDRWDAVTHFDLAGNVRWRDWVGHVQAAPAIGDAMAVVATRDPATLIALDVPSGNTLWQVSLPGPATTAPVIRKTNVYFGTRDGLAARALVDGNLVWSVGGGAPIGPLAYRKGRFACVRIPAEKSGSEGAGGELAFLNAETGLVEKTISGVMPTVPPLLCRDAAIVAGDTGLMRCTAATGKLELWMRTDWLGDTTSPIVMANSRVYFGTANRGLVCAAQKRRR